MKDVPGSSPSGKHPRVSPEPGVAASSQAMAREGLRDQRDAKLNRIMVVEDEPFIAIDIERKLNRLGYEVVGIADNCEDALALFHRTSPDLVLMDIFILGPTDGIETARQIGRTSDVPVVFLTAYADPETVRRASEISPYGYIIKPFDERMLEVAVTIALQRYATDTRSRSLRAAVESATIGIVLVDVVRSPPVIVLANDAFLAMAERTRAEVIGQRACFLAADEQNEEVVRLQTSLMQRVHAEGVVRIKGRTERWSSVTLSPVPSSSDEITHVMVFYKDVTAQRLAEAALADAQRVETIGIMTAGIAHDFNNVLAAISAFAEMAIERESDGAQKADLGEIIGASRRGMMLTRKLLDYARSHEVHPSALCELGATVADTHELLRRLASAALKLELSVEDRDLRVRMDVTSIEQILMNLVANARDAMPEGGKVSVRVYRRRGDGAREDLACLEVRDDGPGMDADLCTRIFDRQFTTKPRGRGTGLGLSICKMLVERAGGSITVESTVGVGSVFTITLPCLPASR